MNRNALVIGLIIVFSVLAAACSTASDSGGALAIDAFSFKDVEAEIVIDQPSGEIAATVPATTDIGALIAVFTATSAESVVVGEEVQTSGTTENSFVEPVVYTLHGADGATRSYTVTVEASNVGDNSEHNAMLGNLGVETDIGTRKDPNGEDVPEDYNPLVRAQSTIFRQCELYGTGLTLNDEEEFILEDKTGEYAPIYTPGADNAWAQNPTQAVAGDFDGDGFEEIAVAVINKVTWNLELRTIEDSQHDFLVEHRPLLSIGDVADLLNDTRDNYWKLDIVAADIDGDSRDELLIAVIDSVYIFDDADEDFKIIDSITYTNITNIDQYIQVAAGDLDQDGKDEFVVVDGLWDSEGVAEYYIYDETTEVLIDSDELAVEIDGVLYSMVTAVPVIADFDGDRLPEIAFSGVTPYDLHVLTLLMDDMKQPTPLKFFNTQTVDNNEGGDVLPASAAADLNGDRIYELIVEEDILSLEHGAWVQPYGNEALPEIHFSILTTGDVTGDMRDDIVLMPQNWESGIDIYGLNSSHAFEKLDHLDGVSAGGFSTLATVNTDFDSAVVEFVGKELLFTDPTIIAAMSCPPYHKDANQNLSMTGTTFGKTKGQEVVTEQSIGFSVGFSIGTEWEAPFGVAKASFKTTVETAFDWTSSQSTLVETSIAYNSGADEDKIVFTTVPFDVFYYEVLLSPDQDQIGETLAINIPRKPVTLSVDREFYNARNGAHADITPEVMGHVIGDVYSYPSPSERDAALETGGLMSDVASVGAGNGSVTLGISREEGEGSGSSFDLNVKSEAEFGAGGVTMGISAGFHYGFSYELTNTESTFFEGSVGDIPTDTFESDLMYQFGLFTYERAYRGQRFVMVDYWVE